MNELFKNICRQLQILLTRIKYIICAVFPSKKIKFSVPDLNRWQIYDPYENMSKPDSFIVRHLYLLSHIAGFSVAVAVWMLVAPTWPSLSRIDNQHWWAIFQIFLALACMVLLHECCHFLFCHWDQSNFLIIFDPGFIGVVYRGQYHKFRIILGGLAPTIFVSIFLVPAYYFDSPYCLLIVICNLAGSGSDWFRAYLTWKYVKNRIWIYGDDCYIPIEPNNMRR